MNHRKFLIIAFAFIVCLIYGWKKIERRLETGKDWPFYGGNREGNRYSPLSQINTKNVGNLKVVWMYNAAVTKQGDIQCQPIVIDGILYGTTPDLNLFALNAATGEQIWKFTTSRGDRPNQNRGVMYWEDGDDKRILYSISSDLYAVNAKTGEIVKSFGANGRFDLHEGLQTNLDHDVSKLSVNATSPGVIYKNTLIIGSSVSAGGRCCSRTYSCL